MRKNSMKRILTYGTFDLLHYGHIRLLKRAKGMGDYLIVALSTDEFNILKEKKTYFDYETRKKFQKQLGMSTWLQRKVHGNKNLMMLRFIMWMLS